jgi:hypothetical protein
MKKVRISVYWPDDWKSVILDQEEYRSILAGQSLELEGEGYSYEGEDFQDYWFFAGGLEGNVIVTYDDGGVGFEGILRDCDIEEISPER